VSGELPPDSGTDARWPSRPRPPSDDGAPADRSGPPPPAGGAGLRGPDLVRAALAQAKAAARAKGVSPTTRSRRTTGRARSGSGPDARDPMRFGAAIDRLVAERGWKETTAAATVLGRWDQLVGAEIADHCQPTSLVDGELVLTAESSAWATQLRMLTHTMQTRLQDQLGESVVTKIVVRGPAQPDWRKGPLRVRGRGPRDTYG
jgi:predicted nucleic acid-binding Zn ribbon protein